MKNKGLIVFLLTMLLMVPAAQAQDVLDGWYFNPDQPGSGFNVNRQADVTGIALFDFEQNGDNQWAISVDQVAIEDGMSVFEGELQAPETGACFDCPFVPNEGNAAGDTIRIVFDTENEDGNTSAQVTLRGQTETYVRNLFRFSSVLDYMLSTWAMTAFFPGPNSTVNPQTELIRFDSVGVTSDGSPFIAGILLTGNSQIATAFFTVNGDDFGVGNVGVLVQDVFADQDQFWLFRAYKESLSGTTVIADDPIAVIADSGGSFFLGARFGATINRNNAIPTAASQLFETLNIPQEQIVKPATPEMHEVAERLMAKMQAMENN